MLIPSFLTLALALGLAPAQAQAQRIRTDPGTLGPALEVVHLFQDQWPTGIAVSSRGRKFVNYPPALDVANTNNGTNGRFTIGEILQNGTEVPYPSVRINSPPGGAINYTTNPPTGANYKDYLIGAQSVVVDALDRVWILDTGRAMDPKSGAIVPSAYGGPKLIAVDLATNKVTQTILFNATVLPSDGYLNDVRIDTRTNLTHIRGNKGVAYITDSGTDGRAGLITVDLGTGESWRHLNQDPRTHSEAPFVAYVWGVPAYGLQGPGSPIAGIGFGSDGIALGADGNDLYWSAVGSRKLYSIPTERLRDHSLYSELAAQSAVQLRTEHGVADGMETDTNGFVYNGNVEQESVVFFNPKNSSMTTFVRDPRINWVDTLSTAKDGYLYFTVNQLNFNPYLTYPAGVERRQKPYVLFRAKLPNNGSAIAPH